MEQLFSLIISTAFTFASAWVDADTLKWGYIDSHRSRFIQRIIFFIPLAYISITGAIGGALIFTALFDQTLNRMRGLSWFYLGTVSYWDKFWVDKLYFYFITKIILLFLGVFLCLI